MQREWGKVIGCGVHIYIYIYICLWTKKRFESYFRDRLTFSNIRNGSCDEQINTVNPLKRLIIEGFYYDTLAACSHYCEVRRDISQDEGE